MLSGPIAIPLNGALLHVPMIVFLQSTRLAVQADSVIAMIKMRQTERILPFENIVRDLSGMFTFPLMKIRKECVQKTRDTHESDKWELQARKDVSLRST